MFCVFPAFASVNCCLVVTCWEGADLLALVSDVYCIFVTFPCGILCQVWYLIVSFPDLCHLSYFHKIVKLAGNVQSIKPVQKLYSLYMLYISRGCTSLSKNIKLLTDDLFIYFGIKYQQYMLQQCDIKYTC